MENYQVDYNHFKKLAYMLLDQIKEQGTQYQAILCPLRGGFYLSYFMSRHLGLPIIYMEISSYSGKLQKKFQIGLLPELPDGRFLLCDDIYDSGNTVKKIHSMYPHVSFDTVCLISKIENADIRFGETVDPDQWVDFFWDIM